MKTKLIKVTKSDIKNGRKNDPTSCPVAIAMCRAFKKSRFKLFHGGDGVSSNIGFYGKYNIPSPNHVREFYRRFDNNKSVSPFEFELKYGND